MIERDAADIKALKVQYIDIFQHDRELLMVPMEDARADKATRESAQTQSYGFIRVRYLGTEVPSQLHLVAAGEQRVSKSRNVLLP